MIRLSNNMVVIISSKVFVLRSMLLDTSLCSDESIKQQLTFEIKAISSLYNMIIRNEISCLDDFYNKYNLCFKRYEICKLEQQVYYNAWYFAYQFFYNVIRGIY